ncbi:hypothetical protein [Virgibacillus dokdonensis]
MIYLEQQNEEIQFSIRLKTSVEELQMDMKSTDVYKRKYLS